MAVSIKHHGHRAALVISVSLFWPDQVPPARAAKNVLAKGKCVLEIILFHDPGRAQAASIEAVLDEILLQHHFFKNFRECVAAGISAVLLLFSNRKGMRIEKMANRAIAAEQDDLLESRACAALFKEPEKPLHANVDNVVRGFLARSAVQHMSDAVHGLSRDTTIGN